MKTVSSFSHLHLHHPPWPPQTVFSACVWLTLLLSAVMSLPFSRTSWHRRAVIGLLPVVLTVGAPSEETNQRRRFLLCFLIIPFPAAQPELHSRLLLFSAGASLQNQTSSLKDARPPLVISKFKSELKSLQTALFQKSAGEFQVVNLSKATALHFGIDSLQLWVMWADRFQWESAVWLTDEWTKQKIRTCLSLSFGPLLIRLIRPVPDCQVTCWTRSDCGLTQTNKRLKTRPPDFCSACSLFSLPFVCLLLWTAARPHSSDIFPFVTVLVVSVPQLKVVFFVLKR